MTQRRHFTRIPFDAEAVLTQNDRRCITYALDLSLKGAMIQRPPDWPALVGSPLRLQITLLPDRIHIFMDAVIAHADEQRIGFQCCHMDVDSAAHLRRLVELNLADPELLNRELAAMI